jgi:flagellar protein FliL
MTVTAMPNGTSSGTPSGTPSGTAKGVKGAKGADTGEEKKPKKLKLMLVVVIALAAAGAAYFLVLAPQGGGKAAAPQPGTTLKLDSMQINLAEGHYLRLGLALQLTTTASSTFDGSAAQDAAIGVYSGLDVGQADQAQQRTALKEKLLGQLEKLYPHEVMGVYYTEYVTQ